VLACRGITQPLAHASREAIGAPGLGSVSIITPGADTPWPVLTVSNGFNQPQVVMFDGDNIRVTDNPAGTLLKLNSSAVILQTVHVGMNP
jgi:hypothetical protein